MTGLSLVGSGGGIQDGVTDGFSVRRGNLYAVGLSVLLHARTHTHTRERARTHTHTVKFNT